MGTNSSPEFPWPGGTPGAEPPDPVAGKPGHFAWSRWVKQFVKSLNTNLMAHQDAADPHPLYYNQARGDARYARTQHIHQIGDLPTGTTGTTVAIGDHTHSQYLLKTEGFRVTHPNTDDTLVEVWDAGKARWQRVHYDSGWRILTDRTGFANWTAGNIYLRREDDRVMTILNGIKVGALSQFWTAPVGFQDNYSIVPVGMREGAATGALLQTTIGRTTGMYWWLPAGYTFSTAHGYTGEGSYQTADPIPTSLPGTLSSAAPA